MEVITLDSEVFKKIMNKLNTICEFIQMHQAREGKVENEDDIWVDSVEVCNFLNVSKRTLQRLRVSGEVTYSTIRGQNFYKVGEIKRLLEERLIKTNQECINQMIARNKDKQMKNPIQKRM